MKSDFRVIGLVGMYWIDLVKERAWRRVHLNTVMNLWVP
jgi:hypothetical protein